MIPLLKKIKPHYSLLLYLSIIPILFFRHLGLHFFNADPEQSQVVLFLSFFLIGAVHTLGLFGIKKGASVAMIVVFVWWAAEYIGKETGLIFGNYRYENNLGPAVLGVPLIIPLVWFAMNHAARCTASVCAAKTGQSVLHLYEKGKRGFLTSLAAAGLMTLWDAAMDFNQVHEGRWTWETKGIWFGIPLHNFLGWFLVALLIQFIAGLIINDSRESPLKHVLPPALFFPVIVLLASVKSFLYNEPLLAFPVGASSILIILCVIFRSGKYKFFELLPSLDKKS